MKKIYITILTLSVLVLQSTISHGQSKIESTVNVEKAFTGDLTKAIRPDLGVEVPDSIAQTKQHDKKYVLSQKPYTDIFKFKPFPRTQIEPTIFYDNPLFARLRIGSLPKMGVDVFAMEKASSNSRFLQFVNWGSQWSKVPTQSFIPKSGESSIDVRSDNSNGRFGIGYMFNRNSTEFSVSLSYNTMFRNLYGFENGFLSNADSVSLHNYKDAKWMKDNLSRNCNNIYGEIIFNKVAEKDRSFETHNKLSFAHNTDKTKLLGNNSNLSENAFNLEGYMQFPIKEEFLINIGYKANATSNIIADSSSLGIIQAQPTVIYKYGKLRLQGGINFSYNATPEVTFYPIANVRIDAIENYLSFYAKCSGEKEILSHYRMLMLNPYLMPQTQPIYTETHWNLNGGVLISVPDAVTFNIFASFKRFSNAPFFINSTSLSNVFDTYTEDYDKLTIGVNASFAIRNFQSELFFKSHKYSMETFEQCWNAPDKEAGLKIKYSYNKFGMSLDGTYKGKCYAAFNPVIDADGNIHSSVAQLSSYFDLNAMFSYKFHKMFTAFLEGNNLTNAKQQEYFLYRNPGVCIMLGVIINWGF